MISLLSNWKLIVIALLLASLSTTAWLLKNSYVKNGALTEKVTRLESVNDELADAHDKRVAEYYALQEKWLYRDIQKEQSSARLSKKLKQAKEIHDETNVRSVVIPDDYWLLIERGASGKRLPADKSGSTESNTNASTDS